jgi:hypothetical protein
MSKSKTMHRKRIKSILHNFLGTYSSRYSDYEGYWLFGMLTRDGLINLQIDLLNTSKESGKKILPMVSVARHLAATKFQEQMEKERLPLSCIREAHLDITTRPNSLVGQVNGRPSLGYNVHLIACAISDHGKTFTSEIIIFVAPHNPLSELCNQKYFS